MIAAAKIVAEQPRLNIHGLSRNDLIQHLRVSPETVDGWLSGARQRPPYFDMAVRAAKAGLHPISSAIVAKYAKELGVEQQRVNFWITAGQVPVPARMAVAWIIHAKITGRG
ncbi:hypothetical protein G6M87_10785 [Rhizobium rhizogenes]|uniref:hypothetical protein n=1 Tax=Rhizobium rhizogenes TaxID=359 RepID=UPI001572ED2F|nr:hypothetical protein [Rhizobium rhizogenes]NTI22342.1 hypothetical protein [Rhizobium rhizogenes]QTG05930.1 hypothetical protein G6M87_10785 [Rhizobium rhizogenes]